MRSRAVYETGVRLGRLAKMFGKETEGDSRLAKRGHGSTGKPAHPRRSRIKGPHGEIVNTL